MAELVRKIEASDLPIVSALLGSVFGDETYIDICRLGGMTNHSYKITRNDGSEYLLRIPGEGTEEMIVRSDERKSTELACELGIDSELIYFGDDGCKIMRFIEDPQPMTEAVMREKANIKQAAGIFRKLHTCGKDTGVKFEVFEMAALYEKIIKNSGVSLYDDYNDVKQIVMNIKTSRNLANDTALVPCHNDSLIGNWVLSKNGRLYLIDWEYSGMNEAMWDLSCLSIECDYTESDDDYLLSSYFMRDASSEEKKYFIASKLYVDYLWTLWGLTRVPFDGAFMQEYADARYIRLKNNIDNYRQLG